MQIFLTYWESTWPVKEICPYRTNTELITSIFAISASFSHVVQFESYHLINDSQNKLQNNTYF